MGFQLGLWSNNTPPPPVKFRSMFHNNLEVGVRLFILSEQCQSHVGRFQRNRWAILCVVTTKHAAEKTKREVEGGFPLDAVVPQREAVL